MTEFQGVRWRYDKDELIADGIVNGVGVVFSLVGATALIFYATVWRSYGEIAAAWVYGLGLVLALSISFSYNVLLAGLSRTQVEAAPLRPRPASSS